MIFYDLPEPASVTPAPTPKSAAGKPAWAVGLPAHAHLVYVRDLGAAALVLVLAVYIAARIIADPSSVRRALRKKVGG